MQSSSTTIPSISDPLAQADDAVRLGSLKHARDLYQSLLAANTDSLDARIGLQYVDYIERGRPGRFSHLAPSGSTSLNTDKLRNLQLNQAEFVAGHTFLLSLPPSLTLEHTTRCNFYCPHCTKGYDIYMALDLEKDLFNKCLDSLLPYITSAEITGFGEPTIGRDYLELVDRLSSQGVRIDFNTNTSTLTLPHLEMLIRNNARIIYSIDGAIRETFEAIRAGGNWDHLQWVLHATHRLRLILGGESTFSITFVAMRRNIAELPLIVEMAHRFGLDLIMVQDYQPIGRELDQESLRFDPVRSNRIIQEARELAKRLHIEFVAPPPYQVESSTHASEVKDHPAPRKRRRLLPKWNRFPRRCPHPWHTTRVKVDGEVTPCCFSVRSMGNLKSQSFQGIWNGWRYRTFRWWIESPLPPPECRICHVYEGINQGNPGNTMQEEGLLISWAYHMEQVIFNLWSRISSRWKKPPPPAPLYFKKGKKGSPEEE
ncbi:radical SAM protein [bacterium]|nr:radical SAM protein [bacterium]NUP92883.1 SPASM domain-containing protein [Candidatus Omnitrophota bacterium]